MFLKSRDIEIYFDKSLQVILRRKNSILIREKILPIALDEFPSFLKTRQVKSNSKFTVFLEQDTLRSFLVSLLS